MIFSTDHVVTSQYRVLADQDGSRIKDLNTRWDKVFPSGNALEIRVIGKIVNLVQSVEAAAPKPGVWDMIFHSEEVAANAENYKKSAENQVSKFKRWQAGLEDVYCKHISPSSRYPRATEKLTRRIWRVYSTHDFHR
jgi:hypothetical protein